MFLLFIGIFGDATLSQSGDTFKALTAALTKSTLRNTIPIDRWFRYLAEQSAAGAAWCRAGATYLTTHQAAE